MNKSIDLGLILKDIQPGEKTAASVRCKFTPMQYPHLSLDGVLIITNYKVFNVYERKLYKMNRLFSSQRMRHL